MSSCEYEELQRLQTHTHTGVKRRVKYTCEYGLGSRTSTQVKATGFWKASLTRMFSMIHVGDTCTTVEVEQTVCTHNNNFM